jgi:hypothetical protein
LASIGKYRMNDCCLTGLHLRSEDQLLLACASTRPKGGHSKALRQLACECKDWDYVLKAVQCHGITALVSSNLDDVAADIVPREPLEVLRRRFRANAARNLFLTQELLSLIRELGAHGISAIPFKGPLLAMTAYGNVAMREFLDLDVLVPKEHLHRAGEVLMQCGYQQPAGQAGENQSVHVESQLGFDFIRKDGKASVELHWSFIQVWLGFEVDLDALWKAPERVSVGETRVRRLPAETELLYLCAHGAKHRWKRLCWVVDVAEQLRSQPGMNWDKLLKTAKRRGSRRTLFLGLHLAHTLLGADLPQEVWTQVRRDNSAQTLAQEICAGLFSSEIQEAAMHGGLANDLFYLRTKERWIDRFLYLRYLSKWLFLPSKKDKQWISLPEGFSWLYFFLRPIRVVCALAYPRSRNGSPPRR